MPAFPRVRSRIRGFDERFHRPVAVAATVLHTRIAVVAAVAAGLVSLSVAIRQYGPTVHPDEWGFLLNGQVLIGRNEVDIPTGSFYPAGFGLITGPLAWVTGSLAGAYRATLLVNFVLCIFVALAAHRVARRVFGMSRNMSVLASMLTFVVPGTIVSSLFAWPETAARLVFLLFVLGFNRTAERRTPAVMCGFGLLVGLMPGLHGRFTLVLPLVCLVFLWWGLERDVSRVAAVGACAVTTGGYACSYLLNRFVKLSLYGTSYDQENRLLRRLVNPTIWPALVRTMTGQSWYLIATSAGLVLVAGAYAVSNIREAGGIRSVRLDAERLTMGVIAASTVLLIFTGGLQLLYGDRGDHLIYGRYVEILVPTLLVMGCAALDRDTLLAQRAWAGGAAAIAGIAVVYVLVDFGDGVKGGYSRRAIVFPNIVGTDAVRYLVQPGLLTFGAVFTALAILFWHLYRTRTAWALTVMIVLLAAGSIVSAERSILSRTRDLRATHVTVDYVKRAGGRQIGFDEGVRNDRSYYYLRWKLDGVKLVRFDISGPDAVIPSEFSCVFGFPDRPPSDGEWRIVADEVPLERVLFQRAGTDRC